MLLPKSLRGASNTVYVVIYGAEWDGGGTHGVGWDIRARCGTYSAEVGNYSMNG